MRSKLRVADVRNLRSCGARVSVHFDASHTLNHKAPHFDVNVTIRPEDVARLATPRAADTYFKFWFSTLAVQVPNGGCTLKYEAFAYEEDLIRASRKARQIREALAVLFEGKKGPFLNDVL